MCWYGWVTDDDDVDVDDSVAVVSARASVGVVLERGECDPGVNVSPFFVRN